MPRFHLLRDATAERGFTRPSDALGSPRRFWTDAQNRELVAKYYPWFLDTYDFLPHPIMKADSVRLLYMHLYGGDGRSADNSVLSTYRLG